MPTDEQVEAALNDWFTADPETGWPNFPAEVVPKYRARMRRALEAAEAVGAAICAEDFGAVVAMRADPPAPTLAAVEANRAHAALRTTPAASPPAPTPLPAGMVDGWRPIETAPRDGTQVDLWQPIGDSGDRIADCRWMNGCWREWGIGDFDTMDWRRLDGREPTHWRPLPAPPAPLPSVPTVAAEVAKP